MTSHLNITSTSLNTTLVHPYHVMSSTPWSIHAMSCHQHYLGPSTHQHHLGPPIPCHVMSHHVVIPSQVLLPFPSCSSLLTYAYSTTTLSDINPKPPTFTQPHSNLPLSNPTLSHPYLMSLTPIHNTIAPARSRSTLHRPSIRTRSSLHLNPATATPVYSSGQRLSQRAFQTQPLLQ
jgi:hypothetical protein